VNALFGFFSAGFWLALTLHTWRDPVKRFFTLWTILGIGACLNIVPIPSQFIACYRAVIPLFGVAGLAGLLFDSLASALARYHAVAAWAAPASVAALLSLLSVADVPYWRSDLVFNKEQIDSDSNFLPGYAGYASTLRRVGRRREAIEVNNQVMARIFPTQVTLQQRVAAIDSPWMLRNIKSQSSLRYQPRPFLVFVLRERGGGEQELGLYSAAIEDYRLALAVQPNDTEVAEAMLYCLEISGRYDAARDALVALIALAPSSARWRRLGNNYAHAGRWQDAKYSFAKALAYATRERNPNIPALLNLYKQMEELAAKPSSAEFK
jgi:tetratricopeptide (TPR) repeat protein